MIVFTALASAVEKPTCTKNVSCPAQPTGQNCTICNKIIIFLLILQKDNTFNKFAKLKRCASQVNFGSKKFGPN